MRFGSGAVVSVILQDCHANVALLPRRRYRIVYTAWCLAERREPGRCGNLRMCVLSGCSLASRADLIGSVIGVVPREVPPSARPLLVPRGAFLFWGGTVCFGRHQRRLGQTPAEEREDHPPLQGTPQPDRSRVRTR